MLILCLVIFPSKPIVSGADAAGGVLTLLSVIAKPLFQGFAKWGFENYCKAKFPKYSEDIVKILSPLVKMFPNLKNAPGTAEAFKEADYAAEAMQRNKQLREDILFQFNLLKERQKGILTEIEAMYLVVIDTNERVKRIESKIDKLLLNTSSHENVFVQDADEFTKKLNELIAESDNDFIDIQGQHMTEVGSFYATEKLPGAIFGHVLSGNYHSVFLRDNHQASDENTETNKKYIAKAIYNELARKIRKSVPPSWDFTESIDSYELIKSGPGLASAAGVVSDTADQSDQVYPRRRPDLSTGQCCNTQQNDYSTILIRLPERKEY